MTEQDPRELIHAIFRMVSTGDFSRAEELIDPEYEEHGPFPVPPGPEGFKGLISTFRSAFPDLQIDAVDILVEGDRAAWRVEGTGTHQGDFNGIPPTGKRVSFGGIDIGEMRNGKAWKHYSSPDMVGLLTQLGVLPDMSAGAPAPAGTQG